MAKLKAPLMSLGASGALGKALVFFGWKGLDVVREYVVPANPKSTGQQTQRDHLTEAVLTIHTEQAKATHPLDEDDITAYALWASVVKSATTWFNQAVKHVIDRRVASLSPAIFRDGTTTPGADELAVSIYSSRIVAAWLATGKFWYGTSKTALIHSKAATPDLPGLKMSATLDGLTTGTKYYWQFEGLTTAQWAGVKSGIYHGVAG